MSGRADKGGWQYRLGNKRERASIGETKVVENAGVGLKWNHGNMCGRDVVEKKEGKDVGKKCLIGF